MLADKHQIAIPLLWNWKEISPIKIVSELKNKIEKGIKNKFDKMNRKEGWMKEKSHSKKTVN